MFAIVHLGHACLLGAASAQAFVAGSLGTSNGLRIETRSIAAQTDHVRFGFCPPVKVRLCFTPRKATGGRALCNCCWRFAFVDFH
jgi:hypothetical protein